MANSSLEDKDHDACLEVQVAREGEHEEDDVDAEENMEDLSLCSPNHARSDEEEVHAYFDCLGVMRSTQPLGRPPLLKDQPPSQYCCMYEARSPMTDAKVA